MAFEHDTTDDSVSNVRQQEDRRRMAYRRAIEQYQESKALHALVSDFPELAGAAPEHQRLH
jgi:hypothetical protein